MEVMTRLASVGSQSDFARRLKNLFPAEWWPDTDAEAPVFMGLLTAAGNTLAAAWAMLAYAADSARLSTAPSAMLDLAADDLFGIGKFLREPGESDASYLARIQTELRATRNTRAAIVGALEAAGATSVTAKECWNAADCGHYYAASLGGGSPGGYGQGSWMWSGPPGQAFIQTEGLTEALRDYTVLRYKAAGVRMWTRDAG